jgi:two-component system copper resistance phosphate regulon response regulator CusR
VRILIVDDDPKYRAFVSKGLGESGMSTASAPDGTSALQLLRSQPFDVVLLDVMLPDLQGWDVLEKMRAEHIETPVIFVTARDAVDERVRGLRMGGDDYIVKPFAFSELVARIHVVLRHTRERTSVRIGDLEIDFLKNRVARNGLNIDLTRTEFNVLRCLAERNGQPVSRTHLLQSVWGFQFDPGTNLVEVQIRRLRRKLDEPFGAPLIHTIRGAGYVLSTNGV